MIITLIFWSEDLSNGIFVIDFLLTTGLLLGTRGSFRIFLDTMKRRTTSGKPVLIYGAGQGGEILLREILNNKDLELSPLGFIDDDALKTGKKLLGYTVLGTFNDLEKLCEKHSVSGILKSFNHDDSENKKKIVQFCRNHNLFLKQFLIHLSDVETENSETDHGSGKHK
jgi:UDP-GlcNAc:undecaprenyl-phosphate/decaprenyl-phosphate GlcNAc-1-phosphate transferase